MFKTKLLTNKLNALINITKGTPLSNWFKHFSTNKINWVGSSLLQNL